MEYVRDAFEDSPRWFGFFLPGAKIHNRFDFKHLPQGIFPSHLTLDLFHQLQTF